MGNEQNTPSVREGTIIGGRYRIGDRIGEGGEGAVFTAHHIGTGRLVAVKVLNNQCQDRMSALRRLGLEARLAASINRRGVVDVLDLDIDSLSGPYLVMELLHGESLRQRLRREGRLSPIHALSMAYDLLQTLEIVHSQAIVHRDLKPENIYFAQTDEGEEVVKILDFGISGVRRNGSDGKLTGPRGILGTLRYIAPEQANGDPTVDRRADLYSVGAILYEALSGRKPYLEVPKKLLLTNVLRAKPFPLKLLAPDLSSEIVMLVERAMARSRDDRFQSAKEMLGAIADTLMMYAPVTEDIVSPEAPDPNLDLPRPTPPADGLHPLPPNDEYEDTTRAPPQWLSVEKDTALYVTRTHSSKGRRRTSMKLRFVLVLSVGIFLILGAIMGLFLVRFLLSPSDGSQKLDFRPRDPLQMDSLSPFNWSEQPARDIRFNAWMGVSDRA